MGPGWGQLIQLVLKVSRHPLRRNTLVLLPMVLTMVLASCTTVPSQIKPDKVVKSSLIPWIDAPSSLPPTPAPIPAPPPQTDAPPCNSANLAYVSWFGAQTSGRGVIIRIRNTGHAACLMSGTPDAVAAGRDLPDLTAWKGATFIFGQVANTPAGKSVYLYVSAPAACATVDQTPKIYSTLFINYPMGGKLVIGNLRLPSYCGIGVSPFFMPKPGPQYPTPPTIGLIPTLKLPATVKAGTTLVYEVDLYNPAHSTVRLAPCPVYMEYSSFSNGQLYHLNCSSVSSIPPGGKLRYQMKFFIPKSTPATEASIHWSFFGPANVGNGHLLVQRN